MGAMSESEIVIRAIGAADAGECEEILRALPEWFGIEESIVGYLRDLKWMPGFAAVVEGRVAGFLALREHNALASELQVMGVRPELHRRGVGRRLMESAEESLRSRGVRLLQVKTLAASDPDPRYARTREFYVGMGFVPLEETALFWGEENPTLIMVKAL